MLTTLTILSSIVLAAGPSSSGALTNGDGNHSALQSFDGLLRKGWGISGMEENPWVQLDLGRKSDIDSVSIWPGNLKHGERSFTEYSRPRMVRILIDGNEVGSPIELKDSIQRLDIETNTQGRTVKIIVDEVYEGVVFRDLFIAEVAINFPSSEKATRLENWKNSSTARRLADTFNEDMTVAYEAHKTAEFGDDEAFQAICTAAAEGAPFLHARVYSLVPAGYRMQALTSSKRAQKAIRKLKDPNGITALQLASLRSHGSDQLVIQEDVEILSAYQDLIGGGNRNLPYWGDTGFNLGGIQSFGEPIAIEIDRNNQVYIADTGNNRIQLFSDEGRPERQWGPKAGIAEEWFTSGRPWYASGAQPGLDMQNGQWWNPTDIAIIADKEGDRFAAIDAKGSIQIFDQEGRPQISWRVETRNAAESGVGGESYLAWLPKQQRLIAFIQNEAVVYTDKSEEVLRWDIEDGIPNAVEVTKKGEILMAFGREVIRYDIGGFRHGSVIDSEILGRGFEDMDLTLDEDSKLWIFTDDGWAYKFKRPGKLDWKIRAYDRPTKHPRIAVQESILFLSHYDRIEQLDLLQLQLDQAEAEKNAEAQE